MEISSLKTSLIPGESAKPTEKIQAPEAIKSRPKRENRRFTSKQVSIVLDRMMRNTRLQYVIDENPNQFIVRIIDQKTDKVIREIPSEELQRIHKGIEEALGILFDELI